MGTHAIKTALGTVIRDTRLEKNYSQDYLASKLGITQNGYSKIELGYSTVTMDRFLEIADVLETDPGVMFDRMVKSPMKKVL